MVVALAGRAAEIQEFGEASSGIASDLAAATNIAAQLVGMLGASESLLSLDAAEVPGAGQPRGEGVRATTRLAATADELMNTAADRAACTPARTPSGAARALADALCEYDELNGDEVHAIVAGAMVELTHARRGRRQAFAGPQRRRCAAPRDDRRRCCTVRSAYSVIRLSWVTMTAAVSRAFISLRISSITCAPILVSSAEVGSSNSTSFGLLNSARPMATR